MLITALTGGIATGKSIVSRKLESLGCYVYSADRATHRIMKPESPAWNSIRLHFGTSVLNERGEVDRKRLGERVFTREADRLFLNRLLHPLVESDRTTLISKLSRENRYDIFISEAALTIEAGYVRKFHRVVLTHCPTSIQLRRLQQRDGLDRTTAMKRIRSQLPGREKLRFADYIIDTSGDVDNTLRQTGRVYLCLEMDSRSLS